MCAWTTVLLVVAIVSGTAAAQGWRVDESGEMVVAPNGCQAIGFRVPRGTRSRITVEPVVFPAGCSRSDFRIHTIPLRGDIYRDAEKACSQMDTLGLANIFQGLSQEAGATCFKDQSYFYPISSSCSGEATFAYRIETRPLHDNDSDCALFDALADMSHEEEEEANLTRIIIVLVAIPIQIFIGLFLCCWLCPGCPAYDKQPEVATTTATAPQQNMVKLPPPIQAVHIAVPRS